MRKFIARKILHPKELPIKIFIRKDLSRRIDHPRVHYSDTSNNEYGPAGTLGIVITSAVGLGARNLLFGQR